MTRYVQLLRIGRHHTLRIEIEDSTLRVFHDDVPVELPASPLGRVSFDVVEQGRPVAYDIQILESADTRIFVGRSGSLIFSDAPPFQIDRTGEVDT